MKVTPELEAEVQALVDAGVQVSRSALAQKYGIGHHAIQLAHHRAIGRSEVKREDGNSTINKYSVAACYTETASELIYRIRDDLRVLLGGRYTLSKRDHNHLLQILKSAERRARES